MTPELLTACAPGDKFQFERHGYFVADRKDYSSWYWVTGLKDSWIK